MRMIRHHTDEGQYLAAVLKEDKKFFYLKYCNSPGTKKVIRSEERYFTEMGETTPDQLSRILGDPNAQRHERKEGESSSSKCIGGEEEESSSQEGYQKNSETLA